MKQLALIALTLFVGAAEARITVYRNQDVLVKTLQSPELSRFLAGQFSIQGDAASLAAGELQTVSVEVLQSSGEAKTYIQKLGYEVKAESGRSYDCTVQAATTFEVITSSGITSSRLSEPAIQRQIRCR